MCDTREKARDAGFDELLEQLRNVVARLEQGNLSLEDSLRAYEEGVALARRGHELLDKAEKRVELLVSAQHGDAPETAPLDEEEPSGSDTAG